MYINSIKKKQDGIYFKILEISKMLQSYGIHFASSKLNFSKYFLKSSIDHTFLKSIPRKKETLLWLWASKVVVTLLDQQGRAVK